MGSFTFLLFFHLHPKDPKSILTVSLFLLVPLLSHSVFWDLYCAAPDRRETCEHSSEAKAFHDYVSTMCEAVADHVYGRSDAVWFGLLGLLDKTKVNVVKERWKQFEESWKQFTWDIQGDRLKQPIKEFYFSHILNSRGFAATWLPWYQTADILSIPTWMI